METILTLRYVLLIPIMFLALSNLVLSETLWSDTFSDGDFTSDPIWSDPPGVQMWRISGDWCLDVHYIAVVGPSGYLEAALPEYQEFTLEFDIYKRSDGPPYNNVHIGVRDGRWYNCYSGFSLMENDCDNIQTRWNDSTLNQVPITSFDERWQHVVMEREASGLWTIIWDQGGPNQTTITGQDQFGILCYPYLWIRCDGYYYAGQGAYFDNFTMLSGGICCWEDNFNDGNYTEDPPWNDPPGQQSVELISGNYSLDVHADSMGLSGYLDVPLIRDEQRYTLEFDLRPRGYSVPYNNVYIGVRDANVSSTNGMSLCENDEQNLMTYWNDVLFEQTSIPSFDDRWYHIIMYRWTNGYTGFWDITWDAGGPHQTLISGQDLFPYHYNPTLWIRCDGYYEHEQGAYFDNFKLEIDGLWINLTPLDTTPIPPPGGIFSYNLAGGNNGWRKHPPPPPTADVWVDVTMPGGAIIGPVFGPIIDFVFPPGFSTDRDRMVYLSGSSPEGTYTLNAYLGQYHPAHPDIISEDHQFFFKSGVQPGDNGELRIVDSGEPFPGGIEGTHSLASLTGSGAIPVIVISPNPFNPVTTFKVELPVASWVTLEIYDISGRTQGSPLQGWMSAGYHEVTFDAAGLASGVYVYRLEAGDFSANGKVVLMK